jgi:glucosamine--fructose-6-phosphate aminotransferase (isomerizing)
MMFPSGTIAVAVSKSGRSPETVAAVKRLTAKGVPTVALVADGNSPLASEASLGSVITPIGIETGAATKSQIAAATVLLAIPGAVDGAASERIAQGLKNVGAKFADASKAVELLVTARRVWGLGLRAGWGVARAFALLCHEKAGISVVSDTVTAFRHGLVEASSRGDAVVLFDCGDTGPGYRDYLHLFATEAADVGLSLVNVTRESVAGLAIPLQSESPGERILEALSHVHFLVHDLALGVGNYVDGFRVLRTHVRPSTQW